MLKIEMIDVDELVPYINNAKEHPEEQIKQIAASIVEFGFNDPIAIDDNNVIIEGHGRLMAAMQLKYESVPTIRLSHMSDAQKKAYILAHNKLTMNSGFDFEVLAIEIEALKELDFDISFTGFTDDEIDGLFPSDNISTEEQDSVPVVDPKSICIKVGDLVEMGDHRLLVGDATSKDDINRLMNGTLADMYLTDPPYNVDYTGKTNKKLKIKNGKMEDSAFRTFLSETFKNVNAVLKSGGVFYIWHADSEGYNFRGACKDAGWKVRQTLIWQKQTLVMGRQDYQWKHEPCLYGWKDGAAHLWASDRKQTTILEFDRPQKSGLHPTMKPVELFEYNLLNNTKGEDIVLDTFLGSGTTLIAAEKNNRICYGLELDPKYAQTIVQRWCDYTSVDSLKINGQKVSWEDYKNAK